MLLGSIPSSRVQASCSMASRCSALAWGCGRCGGIRFGISSTLSKPRSRSCTAMRKWPMCTGSKVPPSNAQCGPAAGGLLADFAITEYHVLLRGQTVQTHRTTGMDFVGGNTDFRAQAVFKTIGKAGGGIHHDGAGIHFGEEAAGQTVVF